jgi:hypothetical protein
MDFPAEHVPLKLTDDGRVVIPIYDQWNNKRGEVVRQCKPYNSWHPKAMSYYDVDYDGMSWFTACAVDNPPKVPVVCLVEDQLSAARLSTHGVTGVALLGTRLTTDRVRTMRRWVAARALDDPQRRSPPVYFALDADAYLEAVKQARFLYNQLDIRVLRLFHDVKDMEDEELANFLRVLSV